MAPPTIPSHSDLSIMQYETKYTVSLQGQRFWLTCSQIEFDSPNYFTACFLGEFKEAQTPNLELHGDPALFSLISTHFCGYKVMSLDEGTFARVRLSSGVLSRDKTVLNLRADAAFFQLDGLVAACDDYISLKGIRDPSRHDYVVVGSKFRKGEVLVGPVWSTRTAKPPLKDLTRPESLEQGFKSLHAIAPLEEFVQREVYDYPAMAYQHCLWGFRGSNNQSAYYPPTWHAIPFASHIVIATTTPPASMAASPTYTVSVRGTDFVLTRSQIDTDAPNYFTTRFLSNSNGTPARHIQLDRDPDLFRIVTVYLSGYSVLPLSERALPPTMSADAALANLRRDAITYQLDGLVRACDEFIGLRQAQQPTRQYLVLMAKGTLDEMDSCTRMMDEMGENIYDPFVHLPAKAQWQVYVGEEKLAQEPLNQLQTPSSVTGHTGLQHISRIDTFVSKSIQNYDPHRWRLVGWHVGETYEWNGEAGLSHYTLSVVVKNLQNA